MERRQQVSFFLQLDSLGLWEQPAECVAMGHQRPKVLQPIGRRLKYNDSNCELCEGLLKGFSRSDGEHPGFCLFEEGNHLLTCNGGEPVKETSMVWPPSKYSISVCAGTRVPRKTGVPPRMSEVELMRDSLGLITAVSSKL